MTFFIYVFMFQCQENVSRLGLSHHFYVKANRHHFMEGPICCSLVLLWLPTKQETRLPKTTKLMVHDRIEHNLFTSQGELFSRVFFISTWLTLLTFCHLSNTCTISWPWPAPFKKMEGQNCYVKQQQHFLCTFPHVVFSLWPEFPAAAADCLLQPFRYALYRRCAASSQSIENVR